MDKKRSIIIIAISLFLVAGLFAAGVYSGLPFESLRNEVSYILKSISPFLFIVLMITLPAAGFPVSVFLIMAGIKFGIFYAVFLWILILPLHATIGYFLSSKLRQPVKRLIEKRKYHVPKIPEHSIAMYSFLFYAIPGIPYSAKNYILPLAGVPFSYCVLMNSIVQAPQGIPFIVLGRSATEMDANLLYISLIMFAVLFITLRWLKRKYWDAVHYEN
ncbi:VTT domain-containing protein [Desulfonatronospira sp.]|uniref:TVP38/TMEM64 family protein n=2 Tax=Desulfonatronospira sp. TaxID=1962951 RepID=UPI0025BFBB6F|nr:VTT domain-containing protein [Desulfonatronospira sp.]